MDRAIVKPSLWRRFLKFCGIKKDIYTRQEFDSIEHAVLSGAMSSLDVLNGRSDVSAGTVSVKSIPVGK